MANATFYIVDKGAPLLGLNLIRSLNYHSASDDITDMCSNSLHTIQTTTQVPNFTVKCLNVQGDSVKEFIHEVKLDQNIKPVQQKVCRLALSVCQDVSNEIQRLLKAGIIEAIDASPWVSPLVVTKKKQCGIHMCVDLRKPNKSINVDLHPLPHMEELFTEMKSATVFL